MKYWWDDEKRWFGAFFHYWNEWKKLLKSTFQVCAKCNFFTWMYSRENQEILNWKFDLHNFSLVQKIANQLVSSSFMCRKQLGTYICTWHIPWNLSILYCFSTLFPTFFALFWKGWNKFGLKSRSAHDTSGDVEASNTILNKD